ncbi:hypothetical protein N2152v2_000404 [Parachlorella kessleri]
MDIQNEPAVLGKVVCPGDTVLQLPETGVVRIAGGVLQDGERLVAVKAGVLQQAKNGQVLWVQSRQRRYIPSVDDSVIGVVTDKHSENFDVDIGGPFKALLPVLAFEGATRRNRPNLQVGDLVYARVESADRDLEPTLTCMGAAGKASGYGPLKGGYLVAVGTALARDLLARPPPAVLQALGQSLQFELAIGLNGRVWVSAASALTTIVVASAIQASEGLSPVQVETMVAALLKAKR